MEEISEDISMLRPCKPSKRKTWLAGDHRRRKFRPSFVSDFKENLEEEEDLEGDEDSFDVKRVMREIMDSSADSSLMKSSWLKPKNRVLRMKFTI